MTATCAAGHFKESERAQARVAGHLQTVRRDQDLSGNGSMQAAQENSWKTATDRLLDGEKKQVGVSKNPCPRRWDDNRIMLQVGAPIIQKRPAAYACIFEKNMYRVGLFVGMITPRLQVIKHVGGAAKDRNVFFFLV